MFVLEKYILNKKNGTGLWEFYATYHDRSLLEMMLKQRKIPGTSALEITLFSLPDKNTILSASQPQYIVA